QRNPVVHRRQTVVAVGPDWTHSELEIHLRRHTYGHSCHRTHDAPMVVVRLRWWGCLHRLAANSLYWLSTSYFYRFFAPRRNPFGTAKRLSSASGASVSVRSHSVLPWLSCSEWGPREARSRIGGAQFVHIAHGDLEESRIYSGSIKRLIESA